MIKVNQSAKFYSAAGLISMDLMSKTLAASWAHGADEAFQDYQSAATYIHPHEFSFKIQLVANEDILKYKGMEIYDAIPVGVPFIYTEPDKKFHNGGLYKRAYLPRHSVPAARLDDLYINWVANMKKYKCDLLMLAGNDYYSFIKFIKTRNIVINFKIIMGADINEINTLNRIKNLFYQINECVFDAPGSHIIYSIICGCTPIFIEEIISEEASKNLLKEIVNNFPKWMHIEQEKYLKSKHDSKRLVEDWSLKSKGELLEIAEHSVGIKFKKNKSYIYNILNPKNKIIEDFIKLRLISCKLQHKFLKNIYVY
jgi:hypothetical protein